MFGALFYYKKIRAEVFVDLWNVVLEENGEDKMIRESNQWTSSWPYRGKDRLVGLVVSMSDYWSWGRGFDPRHIQRF